MYIMHTYTHSHIGQHDRELLAPRAGDQGPYIYIYIYIHCLCIHACMYYYMYT